MVSSPSYNLGGGLRITLGYGIILVHVDVDGGLRVVVADTLKILAVRADQVVEDSHCAATTYSVELGDSAFLGNRNDHTGSLWTYSLVGRQRSWMPRSP